MDAGSDGVGGGLLAQLLAVIDGCLSPEPTHRATLPHVLDTLTALQRDVTRWAAGTSGAYASSASAAAAVSLAAAAPRPVSSRGPLFDVLAIIDAMEALAIDAAIVSTVANAIGTSLTSTLEPLTANRVPIMKVAGVRSAVAVASPPHHATTSVRDGRD